MSDNSRAIRIDVSRDIHRRMKMAAVTLETTVSELARNSLLRTLAEIEAGPPLPPDRAKRIPEPTTA